MEVSRVSNVIPVKSYCLRIVVVVAVVCAATRLALSTQIINSYGPRDQHVGPAQSSQVFVGYEDRAMD